MRIKKILIMSGSKMVDSLVSLFKQTLSAKLGERIDVVKNLDSLHEVIEKDMLPEDFGGKEKPLRALYGNYAVNNLHIIKTKCDIHK